MSESATNTITLSHGRFAIILLAVLLIGLLSGAMLGGIALSLLASRPIAVSGQPLVPARAWIGITYVPITPALARRSNLPVNTGALIVAVTPNSPAATAGLREDDIITAVDRHAIDESTSIMDIVMQKKPGESIQATFLREGAEQTAEIALGRLPARSAPTDGGTPFDRLRRGFTRITGDQ